MVNDSFIKLWNDLASVDCGPKLINQFSLHDFIPNKWFDWKTVSNRDVMIVGQDWGPYVFLKKYVDRYTLESKDKSFDYDKFLFETFSSRTERMIIQSLENSFQERFGKRMMRKHWNDFFFTVAVFFCRTGTLFRGSENFDKKGLELSLPFLKRQINLVKPKVIITLGDMALRQIISALNIPIDYKNLSQFIKDTDKDKYFIFNQIVIIPSFHPAAHVNPKIIYDRLAILWKI
ncbi:MAG: uracil-DNA glycosylase family protein [Patescibacteria group bacterium]